MGKQANLIHPGLAGTISGQNRSLSRQSLLVLLEAILHGRRDEDVRRILRHAETVPVRYLRLYITAMSERGYKAAVKLHCLECVCWQREELRRCVSVHCVFHRCRPYR